MLEFNLLVIRARQPKSLVDFYKRFGLRFEKEKHGSGPTHYSSKINNTIFEIYPLKSNGGNTLSVQIGLEVESIQDILESRYGRLPVVSAPRESVNGRQIVIKDPEGHRIELTEK